MLELLANFSTSINGQLLTKKVVYYLRSLSSYLERVRTALFRYLKAGKDTQAKQYRALHKTRHSELTKLINQDVP